MINRVHALRPFDALAEQILQVYLIACHVHLLTVRQSPCPGSFLLALPGQLGRGVRIEVAASRQHLTICCKLKSGQRREAKYLQGVGAQAPRQVAEGLAYINNLSFPNCGSSTFLDVVTATFQSCNARRAAAKVKDTGSLISEFWCMEGLLDAVEDWAR